MEEKGGWRAAASQRDDKMYSHFILSAYEPDQSVQTCRKLSERWRGSDEILVAMEMGLKCCRTPCDWLRNVRHTYYIDTEKTGSARTPGVQRLLGRGFSQSALRLKEMVNPRVAAKCIRIHAHSHCR